MAGADKDNSYPPEMAERLEKALSDAASIIAARFILVRCTEWTMADFPVFDALAAERHWRELLALFSDRLGT